MTYLESIKVRQLIDNTTKIILFISQNYMFIDLDIFSDKWISEQRFQKIEVKFRWWLYGTQKAYVFRLSKNMVLAYFVQYNDFIVINKEKTPFSLIDRKANVMDIFFTFIFMIFDNLMFDSPVGSKCISELLSAFWAHDQKWLF